MGRACFTVEEIYCTVVHKLLSRTYNEETERVTKRVCVWGGERESDREGVRMGRS